MGQMPQMHQMPYYPMFPTPQWPQWDTYDEAEDDVGVDEYDDDNDTEPEIEQDHDEEAEKPQQKPVITSALLASHKTKYMDETGEDANAEVAELANQIWTAKQEKEALKDLFKRNQRPANVNIRKVDINEEVLTCIPQSAKSRDMRLRSVQGLTAKATVPFVATLTALIDENKPIDRQKTGWLGHWWRDHVGACQQAAQSVEARSAATYSAAEISTVVQ